MASATNAGSSDPTLDRLPKYYSLSAAILASLVPLDSKELLLQVANRLVTGRLLDPSVPRRLSQYSEPELLDALAKA